MLRGRSGAEPELHAVPHIFKRTSCRLPFQFVHIHGINDASEAAADRAIGGVRRGHI
jgi:hypothetical protein